jgi:hypothetical protein
MLAEAVEKGAGGKGNKLPWLEVASGAAKLDGDFHKSEAQLLLKQLGLSPCPLGQGRGSCRYGGGCKGVERRRGEEVP